MFLHFFTSHNETSLACPVCKRKVVEKTYRKHEDYDTHKRAKKLNPVAEAIIPHIPVEHEETAWNEEDEEDQQLIEQSPYARLLLQKTEEKCGESQDRESPTRANWKNALNTDRIALPNGVTSVKTDKNTTSLGKLEDDELCLMNFHLKGNISIPIMDALFRRILQHWHRNFPK